MVVAIATIFVNSWRTQEQVTSVTQATNRGQVVGSTIERAMRNALYFDVTESGTVLRVRTSLDGEPEVSGFPDYRRGSPTHHGRQRTGFAEHDVGDLADRNHTAGLDPVLRSNDRGFADVLIQYVDRCVAGELLGPRRTSVGAGNRERRMLVIDQPTNRMRRGGRRRRGAVLVTVVVVMFVGFIIAATIAASVVFTIGANVDNKDRTQAFIAAESGRDQVRAQLADGCTGPAELHAESTAPVFVADARYVSRVAAASAPMSFDDAGLTSACPTSLSDDDDGWIVIRSTGSGPDGSATTIDSVYPWTVNYELQAGGVLAYFASGVSLRGTYAGDIVVRGGDYNCASEGTLDGDLYVTRGKATFSRDCTVYGDVWTYGNVDGSAQRINISGNVKAGGVNATGGTVSADVKFTSNGTVIGTAANPDTGAIEATGNIDLTDTGSTDGHVWGGLTAGGTITVGSKWILDPSPTPSPSTPPPPFEPTLEFIRSITAWMDLDEASDWAVSLQSTPVLYRLHRFWTN